jgi:hypothetical protein
LIQQCQGCNVGPDQLHIFGCPNEPCPFCFGQLLSCGCIYRQLGLDPERLSAIEGFTIEQEERWHAILTAKGRVPFGSDPRPPEQRPPEQ